MRFYDTYNKYKDLDVHRFLSKIKEKDVRKSLRDDALDAEGFLFLLSPEAKRSLEDMAQKANKITLRNFGRTIQLYTPIYLSNHCTSLCGYCGFGSGNMKEAKKLTMEELGEEARFIHSTGLRHVLILTGDSREESPVSYIKDAVSELKKYFSSISLEVYALTAEEYAELVNEGADGLTIYQEVYDEGVYSSFHTRGPKKEYLFRLEAPERALSAGMRTVNIGVLLGLARWEREVFLMGLHAAYLEDKFPGAEISVSVPRIRPSSGDFEPACEVTDENIVRMILALRIFLPRVGITLSTREGARFREDLVPLGITRMSAGSTTRVGGHTAKGGAFAAAEQFEIADTRSVDEIKKMLLSKGYQPVLKDWMNI